MKKWWLFFLCIGCFRIAAAQNTIGLPQIINYSKSDFQAGTQTWDIEQDSRGMMYFANNEGMLTYDGSHWKAYPLPNRTIVRALAIDPSDRIYAGGQGEMGFFAPGPNGNLTFTSLKDLVPASQNKFADIWRIEIYKEAVFFQASDRIFEYRNNSIKVYPSEWLFLKQAGNKLYAQDKYTGLMQFKNNEWVPLNTNPTFNSGQITGIIGMGEDSLLVNTQINGLFILHNDSIIKRQASFSPGNVNISTRLNATEFVTGTSAEGCVVLNFNGEIVQKISRTEGLQNNDVISVFLDKNNNLWAGLNNGISFIAYNAAIKYITPNKVNELSGYSTRIFNNELYIATSDGAWYVPLTGTGGDLSFAKGDFSRVRNSRAEVWRLDEVNNHILMGQHTGSAVLKDHSSVPLSDDAGAWLYKPISAVYPAKDILVGTYTGIRMLDYRGDQFTDKGKLEGVGESLRFLEIDNNNTIWASHPYRGVYQLQLSPDHKSVTSRLYTDSAGLPSALSNYVFKIKNRVVFGTGKGVYEFDPATSRFIPSAFMTPILGNMEIRYMNEDADGNVWICSGKAMGVVNFNQPSGDKTYTITWIPELNGKILLGFENIYPYNKENIFIGSEKGIIHLNYEKYATSKQVVKVLLGQVKAFGRSDSIIFGGYFHQRMAAGYQQGDREIVSLPKSYNSFHFEYSSPAYGLQNNIEYSYQLEGYESHWSAWSSKSEKDYTNLPDGKYIFRVKAHDNLGHESETVTYSFVVLPAWYKTIWAYIFYILLFMGVLYLLNRWQERKMQRQQRRFDEEQQRLKYIHQLELEKNEKEIIKLQNEKLANEIHFKNNALADASMHLVERGDALVKVKDILAAVYKKNGNNPEIKNALLLLNDVEKNNDNWDQFAAHFDEINNNFLKKLKSKFPALTNTDLKVCAYLQLKLSTKEIAQLMAISVRGVEIKRYRLRKKLELPTEQSMTDFLNEI
ncbi:ligand-binding sensor domain-containing protein [Chitinophaga arvensicola]|uniref:Two component regulator propeller n=1 Tax=Chitinophaga arvensicola TaxID=29529 RepID=A0A1I0QY41_9BACT|nr:triple tyrosine motif-containing protein [Chitinophaga arvensicola]SEW32777.1 Two component regulator propeller [Chitinophaga arvensicola]